MKRRTLFSATFVLWIAGYLAPAMAEGESHLLRYKPQVGQRLTYRVVHSARTKIKVSSTEEASHVHTVSVRSWNVSDVSDSGECTFDHVIDSVVLTQQAGDSPEVRWESVSGEAPPSQYRSLAEKIGKPIDTIRINARGEVLERDGKDMSALGMGNITMPLPEKAIAIGEKWSTQRDFRAKNEAGTMKVIKIRDVYELEKVRGDVATIKFRSEPLTPIDDQAMQSQLVQQLGEGSIKFDIAAGRLLERELQWADDVVGFQGPASNMEYEARLTEKFESESTKTAGLEGPELN